MIQNASARLVKTQKSPCYTLFISLHWLSVAARIKFKTLMLAYRTTTGSAPSYIHSLQSTIYIPSRSLRSASERRLVVPSQRDTKSLSRTFSFTVPGWWNKLPPAKKKCLDICITSTSCVSLPLYNVSLIVFLNCKSLWIKASAKWINVYVMSLAIFLFFIFFYLFIIFNWIAQHFTTVARWCRQEKRN